MTRGRKKAIKTPKILWDLFVEYVKKTKANPVLKQVFVGKDGNKEYEEREAPLSMVGFECFIADNVEGINFPDISHYFENKESYKDFVPISSRIKAVIKNDHTKGAMTMIYSQSVTARLNGWKDSQEVEKTTKKIKVKFKEDE
jgi:hypothetical protein